MKFTFVIFSFILISGCNHNTPKVKTGLEGNPIPNIELLLSDSMTYFNTKNITPGKPTVLLLIEPWCPYCRAQTKAIISKIKSLNGINFCMISNSKFSEFKQFSEKYELSKYPNIVAGIDFNLSFVKYFKLFDVPTLAIYDRNNKLKEILIGKSQTSTIKKIAFN